MESLVLLIGIPGSGKSTWIKNNKSKWKNTVVVCPDDIRRELYGDVNIQRSDEVWKLVRINIISYLQSGKNVVLDATNVDSKRDFFIRSIEKEVNFKKIALIFYVDPIESKRRINLDIRNKVDRCNVSSEIIDEMYQLYLETLVSLPKEGFKLVNYWEE